MDKTTENPDIINERFNLLKLYGLPVEKELKKTMILFSSYFFKVKINTLKNIILINSISYAGKICSHFIKILYSLFLRFQRILMKGVSTIKKIFFLKKIWYMKN